MTATNEVFKEETQTEWHRIVIFGKSAEVIQQHCKKGDALYVEGRIRTNKWQDNSGENKYSTEIVVSNFQLLGSNHNSNYSPDYDSYPEAKNLDMNNTKDSTPTNNDYAKAKGKDKMPSFNEINDSNFDPDDIPF